MVISEICIVLTYLKAIFFNLCVLFVLQRRFEVMLPMRVCIKYAQSDVNLREEGCFSDSVL